MVSRRLFFPLFALVVLALIALAIALFVNTSAIHPSPTGAIGTTGATGPRGATGATGPTGAPGGPGADGLRGAKGAPAPGSTTVGGGTFYLKTDDLISSLIEIPTSNVAFDSSTLSSMDLAGAAPMYNSSNVKVGEFSGAFLSLQTADGLFTDVSGNLSINNGLVVAWSRPATVSNFELDSIVGSLVAETKVTSSTNGGSSTYFGKRYDLVVSSDATKIYFQFNPTQ